MAVESIVTVSSETGTLANDVPYATVGRGPRTLVVLPGFGDAMFDGTYPATTGFVLGPYFAAYLDAYTVYLVSRPRGLPDGYDADDAVETHARVLESLEASAERLHVIGISMGGLIGLELARRRPDLVDRLVLANSACRLDESARPAVRQLEALAREHRWSAIRARLARALYSDVRTIVLPPFVRIWGGLSLPKPAVPADVRRSIRFILEFDASDVLEEIDVPTHVFTGERDPYFTPAVAGETAEGVVDGGLTVARGAKHGAFHERKVQFDATVRSFLDSTED